MSFPPHLLIPARLSSVSASKLRSILGSPATTDPWERKARRDNQRSSPSHWAAGWAQQRLHVSLSLSALLRRRERAPHGPARPGLDEARVEPELARTAPPPLSLSNSTLNNKRTRWLAAFTLICMRPGRESARFGPYKGTRWERTGVGAAPNVVRTRPRELCPKDVSLQYRARAKPAGGTGMSKALDDTHGGYFHEDTFPG
ncbi:unnamed protein product [Lampetra fluviatilis]